MARAITVTNRLTPERIKAARKNKGFTQKQLAESIDVSIETIKRYEKGTSGVPEKVLRKLASALDVIPEYLEGETDKTSRIEYMAERLRIEDKAADDYFKEAEEKEKILERFFVMFCGFRYSYDREAQLTRDFSDLRADDGIAHGKPDIRPIKLSRGYNDPKKKMIEETFSLSEKEFEELLSKVKSCVENECYINEYLKQREAIVDGNNGRFDKK